MDSVIFIIVVVVIVVVVIIAILLTSKVVDKSVRHASTELRELFEEEYRQDNLCAVYHTKSFVVDSVEYKVRKATTGDLIEKHGEYLELINVKTDKVVFRKGKYSNNLGSRPCDWYHVNQTFIGNI